MSFSIYSHGSEDTIDPTTNPAYNIINVHNLTMNNEIIPSELHSDGYVKFVFLQSCMDL